MVDYCLNFNTGGTTMVAISILAGLVVLLVGAVLFLATEVAKGLWAVSIGFAMVMGAAFVGIWQEDKERVSRESRTRVAVGSVIEVDKENVDTDKCFQSFNFKVREDKQYARLPYTFIVNCDKVLRHGDLARIIFVTPKAEDGKPEVLDILNLTFEMEKFSVPPSLMDTLEAN